MLFSLKSLFISTIFHACFKQDYTMVLSRETQGKLSGLQCSSQVKEEPWSLSYLTLYYIEATSVGTNPWTRLYSVAVGKKLSRMSCLTKNWKWKIKGQEKFSFLPVFFTFILVYYSIHRKKTRLLLWMSLAYQCLRGICTMPFITCFDFWSALKWSRSWT